MQENNNISVIKETKYTKQALKKFKKLRDSVSFELISEMKNPVLSPYTGNVYEKDWLEIWIDRYGTDPICRDKELKKEQMVSGHVLKDLSDVTNDFVRENKELYEELKYIQIELKERNEEIKVIKEDQEKQRLEIEEMKKNIEKKEESMMEEMGKKMQVMFHALTDKKKKLKTKNSALEAESFEKDERIYELKIEMDQFRQEKIELEKECFQSKQRATELEVTWSNRNDHPS